MSQKYLPYSGMDFQELVNSFIYMNSLVTYPNGKSRSMDIDSISFCGKYIQIRSGKTFRKRNGISMIEISMTELTLANNIKQSNPTWDYFFIGTESNMLLDDDDYLSYISIESALKIKQDNSSAIVSWKIPRQFMHELTRKEFNFYMNDMLDIKGDPFHDPKEVALRNFEKYRNGR